MTTRTALLLASAALLAAANPALAQDGRYGDIDAAEAAADAAAEAIEWEASPVIQNVTEDPRPSYADRANTHRPMDRGHSEHAETPRFAYSAADREAWLADCRIVMRGEDYYYDQAEYDDGDDEEGGLLGGLLGAVVGGIAGNRIGGSGDRLAGTLIGAGVGGIAGAVLGSVIGGGDNDRDYYDDDRSERDARASDAYAADYCGAYLRRYEASGHTGQVTMAYAQPMMMASGHQQNGTIRETIREEWVDVPVEHVTTRRRTVQRRAAPRQGKLQEIK